MELHTFLVFTSPACGDHITSTWWSHHHKETREEKPCGLSALRLLFWTQFICHRAGEKKLWRKKNPPEKKNYVSLCILNRHFWNFWSNASHQQKSWVNKNNITVNKLFILMLTHVPFLFFFNTAEILIWKKCWKYISSSLCLDLL